MIRRPPRSPLFPYPPLSRSLQVLEQQDCRAPLRDVLEEDPPRREEDVTAARRWRLQAEESEQGGFEDRKSTRLNSSHGYISYAVFCLKKKKKKRIEH